MTRVFYTSHIEATLMAQYHGVRYEPDNLTVANPEVFNPQPGDLCLIAGGNEAHQVNRTTRLPEGQKIIMRDGKPFIWPCREGNHG